MWYIEQWWSIPLTVILGFVFLFGFFYGLAWFMEWYTNFLPWPSPN